MSVDKGDIIDKPVMSFKNNKELEKYYTDKWAAEGYSKGFVLNGINLSEIFHKDRQSTSIRLLDAKEGEVILDAGCGRGDISIEIAKKCKKVYAIDIAKTSFKKNKETLKNITFKKMNVEKLEFKDNTFDKIVCVETIEHVLDPMKALQEFNRVLKPQGELVLSYPFIENSTLGRFEMKLGIRKKVIISEHLTEWSYDEVIANIKNSGFELKKSEGINYDMGILVSKIRRINAFLTKTILKFQLRIRNHPRNSTFAVFVFKK